MARRHTRHTKSVKQDPIDNQQEQNDQGGSPAQTETADQGAEDEKEQIPTDIPEAVWTVYQQAFLEFNDKEHRRFIKGCEKQIGQLERRIARKKS